MSTLGDGVGPLGTGMRMGMGMGMVVGCDGTGVGEDGAMEIVSDCVCR